MDTLHSSHQLILKGVNNFFSVYWAALQYAVSQASVVIRPLILRMDPFQKVTWQWADILTMLSFGLAFIGAPAVSVWLLSVGRGFHESLPLAASIFAVGIQNSPSTARVLMPNVAGLETQLVQEGQLSEMLSRAAQPLEEMMNNALHFLMTDLPSFVRFVQCKLDLPEPESTDRR